MELSKIYDKVISYATDPASREIITTAHTTAIEQVANNTELLSQAAKIIELGVGDARFLALLNKANPNLQLFGNDFSGKMLAQAKQRVPNLTAIHAPIEKITKHIPTNTFDLTIAHFIAAYVGIDMIFEKATELLNPHGKLSLVTSISESFPKSRKLRTKTVQEKANKLVKFIDRFAQKVLDATPTPMNYADIVIAADKFGFKVIARDQFIIKLNMQTKQELFDFVIHGSWGANLLNTKFLPNKVVLKLVKKALSYVDYPFEDDFIAEAVLLEKV